MTENDRFTGTPPLTSMWPSRPCRQAVARPFWMALVCMHPGPRPMFMATGPFSPMMRAASRTSSGVIQQTSAARSGVQSFTRSASSSKPYVHLSTKSWSYHLCSMTSWMMASASAPSVPGRGWMARSACLDMSW